MALFLWKLSARQLPLLDAENVLCTDFVLQLFSFAFWSSEKRHMIQLHADFPHDMISVIDSSATVRGVAGLQCESALPPSVPLRELLAREPCNEHLESWTSWNLMEAEAKSDDEKEDQCNNEQMHATSRKSLECHPHVMTRKNTWKWCKNDAGSI